MSRDDFSRLHVLEKKLKWVDQCIGLWKVVAVNINISEMSGEVLRRIGRMSLNVKYNYIYAYVTAMYFI